MEANISPQQSHISVSLSTIATPSRKVSHSEAAVDRGTKSCHMPVRLGANVDYRIIGHLFGVGLSTVCVCVCVCVCVRVCVRVCVCAVPL